MFNVRCKDHSPPGVDCDPFVDHVGVPEVSARTFYDDGGIRVARRDARRARAVARQARSVLGASRGTLARDVVRARLQREGLLDQQGRLIRNRTDAVRRTPQQEQQRRTGRELAAAVRGRNLGRAQAAFRRARASRGAAVRADNTARRRAARAAERARRRSGVIA